MTLGHLESSQFLAEEAKVARFMSSKQLSSRGFGSAPRHSARGMRTGALPYPRRNPQYCGGMSLPTEFVKLEGESRTTAGDKLSDREGLACRPVDQLLKCRMLMTSVAMPPTPWADAYLMRNLLSQFNADEAVVAAEKTRYNADYYPGVNQPKVYFVTKLWTWPKRGQRFLHWLKWGVLPRTTYRLARIARRENCTAILANFPSEHLLFAAFLAAKLLRIPLFAYLHNTYRENRRGVAYLFAGWLQKRVFRRAKLVFVMSDGMREVLKKAYPNIQFETLVHTFAESAPQFEPLRPLTEGPIRVGLLGTINDSNLDATGRICDFVKRSSDLQLSIYTGYAPWLLEKKGFLGPKIVHEQPTDDELMAKLRSNDILALPHGFSGGLSDVEYATIFPTRMIPYLLAGRPIVAHCPPGTFLHRWLLEHDCAEIVDRPDTDMLAAAFERLRIEPARSERLVRNAMRAARQFQAGIVIPRMKSQINQAIDSDENTALANRDSKRCG
jgi:Glycosyltransferase Family 4